MDVLSRPQNNAFAGKTKEWYEKYLKHSKDAAKQSVDIY
jgi:hypothetical protein